MDKNKLPPGLTFEFQGEGKLGTLIRTMDWSQTPIGPMENWPLTLKGYVSMILRLPTPAGIFWGPEQILIYNDAYSGIIGALHPRYLGLSYKDTGSNNYPVVYSWMQRVLEKQEIVKLHCSPICVTRKGYNEEAFFTFSFSPLMNDQEKTGGILQILSEVTDSELAQRRLKTIKKLSTDFVDKARIPEHIIEALSSNPNDIRFALVFLVNPATSELEYSVGFGVNDLNPKDLKSENIQQIIQSVSEKKELKIIEDIQKILPHSPIPPWPELTKSAVALPIYRPESDVFYGVVLLGISPRLEFDAVYREFFCEISRGIVDLYSVVEQRQAFEKLKETRDGMERFFDQAPVAICVYSGPNHIYEFANKMYYEMISDKRGIIGKTIREVLPEIGDQGYFMMLDRVYQTGEPFVGRDAYLKIDIGNGKTKDSYVDFVCHPRRDHRGNIDGIVAIATDVTDRKHAEDRLKVAMQDAQLANQSKSRFLANMSHEIRTPLGIIQGFADLALDPAGVEIERINHLLTIKRNAENLTKLLGEVLDLTKIEAGKIEIERVNFALTPVVEEIISLMNFRARDKGVTLSLIVDGDVPKIVNSDLTRLRQILLNLVGNAIKFTEKGSVTVHVNSNKILNSNKTHILFKISDTGIGISEANQNRLFQAFTQADNTMTRKYGGTGLGLNLSKNLAQALGGDLSLVNSELGKGSSFEFSILSDLVENSDKMGISKQGTTINPLPYGVNVDFALSNFHILVIEDSLDNQMLISWYLRHSGAKVDMANDGVDGLKKILENDYDVIIMDIQMPKMDGYETTQKIRDLGIQTPIVALTAHALSEERDKAMKIGCNDYLTKPFNRDSLIQTIASHLGHALQ